MTALALVSYLAVAIFVAAVVILGLKIASMPVHLRWELYPVAQTCPIGVDNGLISHEIGKLFSHGARHRPQGDSRRREEHGTVCLMMNSS